MFPVFGRRRLTFVAAWLACAGGCGGGASPDRAGSVGEATRVEIDGERRARLLERYESLRDEGFAEVPEIRAEDLLARLGGSSTPEVEAGSAADSRRPVVLVDVRSDAERAVSTLPDAISSETYGADPLPYRDCDVVVFCTIGVRSGLFARELRGRGVAAFNLVGGVLAWAHADGAFVDESGDRTNRVHTWSSSWNYLPADHEGVH